MLYHLNSRSGKKIKSGRLLATIAVVLFLLLANRANPDFFPKIFAGPRVFLLKTGNNFLNWFSGTVSLLRSKEELLAENESLRMTVNLRENAIAELQAVQKENGDLTKLVGQKESYKTKAFGFIIAKPPVLAYDTLIIDVGENSAIKVGDPVIWDGWLLGEVEQVSKNFSQVKLFGRPNDRLTLLAGPKAIQVEADSLGNGSFSFQLPKETEIAAGDLILKPGLRRFPLGKVIAVNQSVTDPIQTILFRNPVNAAALRVVKVISI
jgi:cell shape-determining protein MreC